MTIATTNPLGADISTTSIDKFGQGLRGQLLRPDASGYEAARTICECHGRQAADDDRALCRSSRCRSFGRLRARQRALLSVRGGGHNVTGNAVCDGGLMIDLSSMKGIRVDPHARTVRAEGRLHVARS